MKNLFRLIIIGVLAVACSPSSRITGLWKKPKFKGSYSDAMVAALTRNVDAKSTIENDLAIALTGRGVLVTKSMDIFPPSFAKKEIGKQEMMRKIRRNSALHAIVAVSLIHKETASHYVPGSYGYAPVYNYYGRFWGSYIWYPAVYSQGYYTQDKVYYLETDVYDVKTEELVWSATSETYNPENLSGFSRELAGLIADRLIKDGIFHAELKFKLGQPDNDVTSRNR